MRWKALTPEQRGKYEMESQKDRTRYEFQLKQLKDQGYFIMDDGTKSSEKVSKKKVKASEVNVSKI